METSTDKKILLRVEEVAGLVGLSRSTLYELIGSGRLPAVHVGRSMRVSRAAVDDFVRRLQEENDASRKHAEGWD